MSGMKLLLKIYNYFLLKLLLGKMVIK